MSNQMDHAIDFVITWVDGDDPAWQTEKQKYVDQELSKKSDVAGKERYEDNGLLRYWFRGVEQFAPWVRKIFFVTWGHLPSWLNVNNPKLVIVKHQDFLPANYRPTFNSVSLNLNLHRIEGLSERFVYFNDDMYLVSPCAPQLFFKKGLPRDMAVQDVIPATGRTAYWSMVYNDIIMLNNAVSKKSCIKKHLFKWMSLKYGKNLIKNILLSPLALFTGIYETHLPASYLKVSYSKIWKKYETELNEVSTHKVRCHDDISENFIRYVQMAEGNFCPINKLKYGRYCSMKSKKLYQYIVGQKYKYLCINDNGTSEEVAHIKNAFDKILNQPSSFELN